MERNPDKEAFEFLRDLVYRHSGIRLSEAKGSLLRNRLRGRLRALGLATYNEYAALLKTKEGRGELASLLDAVSTNYTFFFREEIHFEHLKRDLIPRLLREKERQRTRRIRVWSAGCSTGEEPYSIALSFASALGDLDRWDFKLLATDINREVLGRAQRGVYLRTQLHAVPPDLLNTFFARDASTPADSLRVSDAIRSHIAFRRLNLTQDTFPFQGTFDVIFCRNVMIYFDHASQEKVVRSFCRYLARGGHFFIGHSESLMTVSHGLESVSPTLYRKP